MKKSFFLFLITALCVTSLVSCKDSSTEQPSSSPEASKEESVVSDTESGIDGEENAEISYTSYIFPGEFYTDYVPEANEYGKDVTPIVIRSRAELYEFIHLCEPAPYSNALTDFGEYATALPLDYFDEKTLLVIYAQSPELITEYNITGIDVSDGECTVAFSYKYSSGYVPEGVQNTLLVAELDNTDIEDCNTFKTKVAQITTENTVYNTENRDIEFNEILHEAYIEHGSGINGIDVTEPPTVFIINTRAELEILVSNCSYNTDTLLVYDDEFFEESSLILTYITSSSGGDLYWYNGIFADENGITLDIGCNLSGMTYDDLSLFLTAEVNKEDIAGCEQISVNRTERMVLDVNGNMTPLTQEEEDYVLNLFNNRIWNENLTYPDEWPQCSFLYSDLCLLYYPSENKLINDYTMNEYILSDEEKATLEAYLHITE